MSERWPKRYDEYCMWESSNENALILQIRSRCPHKLQKISNKITENRIEVHSEPSQTSNMNLFTEIVNG